MTINLQLSDRAASELLYLLKSRPILASDAPFLVEVKRKVAIEAAANEILDATENALMAHLEAERDRQASLSVVQLSIPGLGDK